MKDTLEKEILEILRKKQRADIGDLASELYVSPSTVRRKLTELQQKGLVTRTHGGAQINDESNFFPSFTFRAHLNSLEKKKIALSAIKLIKNGDFIFLDGSTSTFFIAGYLDQFKNITVVTNGIDTLSRLTRHNVKAYSTGGFVSAVNKSVLVGHHAETMVSSLYADIAFCSAQSVSKDGIVYDCFEDENIIRNCMHRHAKQNVFLCDSTKFGKMSPYRLGALKGFDYLVSDRDIHGYFDTDELPQILFD